MRFGQIGFAAAGPSGSFEDSQEAMRDHLARVARAMSKMSKSGS
jgi:hypothetical protein